jgi:hypothetical protein
MTDTLRRERATFLSVCGLAAAFVAMITMWSVFTEDSFAVQFETGERLAGFDASGPQAAMVLSVVAATAAVVLVGAGMLNRATWVTGSIALFTALCAPWYAMAAMVALQLTFG